jgi:delta14-sterol reductase
MPLEFMPLTGAAFVEALLAETAFMMLLALGSLVLPGAVHRGFKLNGLLLFVLVSAGALLGDWLGLFSLAGIPPRLPALLVAANVIAFGLALVLLVRGRQRTGHMLADYFFGADANPRWMGLDLKMFSYRPSLIGLGLVNLSFAALQAQAHGVSLRMLLYQVFCLVYLANYFQFEYGMLFTWDVIAEKFGWMLVWGDYVLVPFFYSLPGLYLVNRTDPIGWGAASVLVVLYAAGFCLFRGANEQKHRFKLDPSVRIWGSPARSIDGRLLVSGFWGIGRKLNYTGEICIYWSWSLLCGFESAVPYLLPLWLTCFLPHRAWRDEKRCRAKYGPLWEAYCDRAKFRMIPFVY